MASSLSVFREASHINGSGRPIDPKIGNDISRRLGFDFRDVRVHNDAEAVSSARLYNAKAYTYGSHIVFNRNEYAPQTEEGRSLITHELAHVAQQGAAKPLKGEKGASFVRERVTDPCIQRTPGEDAEDSWNELVAQYLPEEPERQSRAKEAARRMLSISLGQELMNTLWKRFCAGTEGCEPIINLSYLDQLPSGHENATGVTEKRGPRNYDIVIKNQLPDPYFVSSTWGSEDYNTVLTVKDPESRMANAIFHEILHVRFRSDPNRGMRKYPTGHGIPERGEIEPEFMEQMREFGRLITAYENELKSKARPIAPSPKPAAPQPDSSIPNPDGPSPKKREKDLVDYGFNVSLQGGGGGGHFTPEDKAGSGAISLGFNANLIFADLHALGVGVRGIYLSPDRLLAGGVLNYRILEDTNDELYTSGSSGNPYYFDLEAGFLGTIHAGDADKALGGVSLYGGAGLGQEYGTVGPRFYWRLGGFVIVSDFDFKEKVGGVGAGGLGVSL